MHCRNCGAEIDKGTKYCPNCGQPMEASVYHEAGTEAAGQSENNTAEQSENMSADLLGKTSKTIRKDTVPSEYKPISMWGYLGYEILFAIPIVGFILVIVFSFAPKNRNLKNFSRSYFLLVIILSIVFAVLMASGTIGTLASLFG